MADMAATMGRTTIQISDELADELHDRKDRGDSYEDVIWRNLDSESSQDGGDESEEVDPEPTASDDIRERAEAVLSGLEVRGRPDRVERTRREAIMYGWGRLREEQQMRPRDLANDIFGKYFEDADLGYSTASGRYAGYQMWDNCVREVLKELPGVYDSGHKWEFREEDDE